MTDRELLELAAKAAGYSDRLDFRSPTPVWTLNETGQIYWNPLSEDGDAFRLAVKLGLEVHPSPRGCSALWDVPGGKRVLTVLNSVVGCDSEGSTRLVVVRAAAEIGRAALAQEQGESK